MINRRRLIIVITALLIVIPVVVINLIHSDTAKPTQESILPPERSEADFYTAIATSSKYLRDEKGSPTFKIKRIKKISANWYAVWIDDGMKLLMYDTNTQGAGLSVKISPRQQFTESEMIEKNVPDAIYQEIIDEK